MLKNFPENEVYENLCYLYKKLIKNKINISPKRQIPHNILEVKYDNNIDLENKFEFNIANSSNLILQRSSKYCDAIETVYN